MRKSALSDLFQDQTTKEDRGCNDKVTREHVEERKADINTGKRGTTVVSDTTSSFFQLPLHYPKYTKKDYDEMPEWKLDGLLAEYGLLGKANWNHIGDLASKRELAIGTFLWPEAADTENCPPSQGSERSYDKNADANRIVFR